MSQSQPSFRRDLPVAYIRLGLNGGAGRLMTEYLPTVEVVYWSERPCLLRLSLASRGLAAAPWIAAAAMGVAV